MFVCQYGKTITQDDLKNSTLVIPSHCAGLSSHIACELYCLNSDAEKIGFYKTDHLAPVIINDALT